MRVRRGKVVVPMPAATMSRPLVPVRPSMSFGSMATGVLWYVTYLTQSCCGREEVRVRVRAPTAEKAVEEARMQSSFAMGHVVDVRRVK
jgi:hypothetical protein